MQSTAANADATWHVATYNKTRTWRVVCEVVPGVGFEPTHLSISVFETDASAIPPPGHISRQQKIITDTCVMVE